MWVKRGVPTVLEASTVVSLMGDILSPKYAPLMTAPAIHASSKPSAWPIPIKAIPIVATVVHDEPVNTLTKALMRQAETRNHLGLIISIP